MRRWLPIITPPWWIIAIPLVLLLGWHAIWLIVHLVASWKYGPAVAGDIFTPKVQEVNAGCGILYALLYGAFRATAFHPMFRPGYRKWLANTPWTSRLPMPLGPIHWIWQDALFLAPAILLAWGPQSRLIIGVPFAFVVSYSLLITVSLFITGERVIGYGLVLLGGLVLHFAVPAVKASEPLWLALTVCVLAYPLLWWGLRRSLDRFSNWDLGSFETQTISFTVTSQDEAIRRRTAKQLGWPFDALRLTKRPRGLDVRHQVLIGLLAGWWVYAMHLPQEALRGLAGLLFVSPVCLVIAYRIECRPPISLWGRLRTGHWIIPGYDRCFLWPLAILGLQWAWLVIASSLPLAVLVPVQETLFVLSWIKAAAARERFQLTGSHRIPVPFTISSNSQGFTNA